MLRTLSAFLLVFCLLSLVVHQDAVAGMFGAGSASLFAFDLLRKKATSENRLSRTRVGSVL